MKNPTLLAFFVAIIGITLLPISQSAKLVLGLLIVAGFLYWKRGYILVALGSRALGAKEPNEEKAWRLYGMAWKAGLPANYTVMLANLYVQRGDAHIALEIYDSVLEKEQSKRTPNGEVLTSARIARTMALWVLDRKDEAIDALKALYDDGRRDKTLLINLGTYLLDTDRLEEAGMLLDENADQIAESPGLTDNKGWYLYKTGALLEARQVYDDLLLGDGPRFPEAFAHGAMVMLALDKSRKAKVLFQKALEREFFNTSTLTREDVQHLLDEVQVWPDSDDEDDDPVDKELTSSLYENDLFDDSLPNTDVDDDDEVEPNIELDPEDYDDDDPEVIVDPDDISEEEALFFDDDYDDGDDREKK